MEAPSKNINWQALVGLLIIFLGYVFAAGKLLQSIELQHKEIEQLQTELEQTKEQLYKEIEQRVDDLEEWRAYIEGYQEFNKAKNNGY